MKAAILLVILAFARVALAGDVRVTVISALQTNAQTGRVYGQEVFTRNGQTNLVRITKGETAATVNRIYHFYHAGHLVANLIVAPAESVSVFNTEAGPYCVSLRSGPSGEIQLIRIGDKDGVLLDEFVLTKGVFSPREGPLVLDGRMKPQFGQQEPANQKLH